MRQILIFSLVILFSCSSHKNEQDSKNSAHFNLEKFKNMSFTSYPELWQKVKTFEKNGQTKSANQVVLKIYEKAHQDQNGPQIIKALLYRSKYMMYLEEDSQLKIIHNFEHEIAHTEPPVKNLLESYLAQLYWQYYRQNRWRFAKRTAVAASVDPKDFRTWDLRTIFKAIYKHFNRSLQNPTLLQTLPIQPWHDILDLSKEATKYQPTLYDLLIQEALHFYRNKENALPAPTDQFTIDDARFLSPVDQFITLKINTKDSLSNLFQALKLEQQYLHFKHADQAHLDALAYADFQRLKFVYDHAVFADKNQAYLKALQNFIRLYKNTDEAALAYHQIALLYHNQGQLFVAGVSEAHQWDKKKALDWCQKAQDKYPDSKGAKACKNLMTQILQKSLHIEIEKFIPEQKPALIKLTYKNVDRATLKIYKIAYETGQKINKIVATQDKRQLIEQQNLVKTYNFSLTNPKDYQQHSTERIIDGLSNGMYILMLSLDHTTNFGYHIFQVTDIVLQSRQEKPRQTTYALINRLNGRAYPKAEVVLKKRERNQDWHTYKTLKTNTKGNFTLNKPSHYYQPYLFIVTYDQGKKAYFQDYVRDTYVPKPPRPFNTAFIFTDRSIYRPGQSLYFKAICLTKKENHSTVLKAIPMHVKLLDVNRQKIAEQTLTTNDFGAINGTFILPEQTLTGNFTLEIQATEHQIFNTKNFKVEAYKRPKFEVILNKPEKTYKVNDSIPVEGLAKSFAGTNITSAQVTYRVKREVLMPRWWYWSRPSYLSEAQEIAHGYLTTDAKGKFVIKFKALADRRIKPETNPIFYYKIYAEVTDLNGETHSHSLTVKVGYRQLQAQINLPNKIQKGSTDTLKVKTINLNDVKVSVKGHIAIYKLKAPDRVLRHRPWSEPDKQEISKQYFVKSLPHMPYDKSETKSIFWPQGKLYWSEDIDTGLQEKILFHPGKSWPNGTYIAWFKTRDKNGHEVLDKQLFQIYDSRLNEVADHQFFNLIQNKSSFKPGEMVSLSLGSAGSGNFIRVWLEKGYKIMEQKLFKTDGTYKTIRVPVTEKDRGGFVIHYSYNAYNDYRSGSQYIKVPYPSDQLEIETLRFRDKLKPGQPEEWRFKIKGPQSHKVTAEVLASMYDASLDQFVSHNWSFNPVNHRFYQAVMRLNQASSYGNLTIRFPYVNSNVYEQIINGGANRLKWFGFQFYSNRYLVRQARGILQKSAIEPMPVSSDQVSVSSANEAVAVENKVNTDRKALNEDKSGNQNKIPAIRTDFKETAFFYPELYTDKDGNVGFKFTAPESLTKWKLQILAHTKDLKHGYKELFAQTQKDLMVFPNAPRFVRQGDTLIFSTKISNLSGKKLSGIAELILKDAIHQKNVTERLITKHIKQGFQVDAAGNIQVRWKLIIPDDIEALQYIVKAKAGHQTDAEQNFLPVLSNRMLVTETMPMWVRSGQTKTFVLDKLLHPKSSTLKNHRLTLEITSNPAWYAVQALPYLMEYPYECSEQTFSRYYANSLAAHIVKQNPKIKRVFDLWKTYQTDALLSNLEKNQELKSIILAETPWLLDAQSETEQKKRIGLLFDLNKMSYESQTAVNKLQQMQLAGGGFVWFKGGRYPNRYITQHIVAGFGHLKQLGVIENQRLINPMVEKALKYLDSEIRKDYENLLKIARSQKDKSQYLENYHPGAFQLHYLYARSFYPEFNMSKAVNEAVDYYRRQAQKYWLSYGLYEQGLLALVSHRHNDSEIARKIIRSLDENSIKSDEMGMYWKNNTGGWHWYQAPIETQALLIEAFDAIDGDVNKLDEMRIWLLKNKQTNAWKTTKQTTEAIYALLLSGSNFLALDNNVGVKIGHINIQPNKIPELKIEAGTGYFKKSWAADQIEPAMAKVQISKKAKGIAWGALYWQYFEDLDKITTAKTPVSISKELFVRNFTDAGEILHKIDSKTKVEIGDLIRVRIEIKVDRPMEYVHLKDMRAAGFEPINVLSRYKWQDGLGYYEATGDAATNFFIGYLPKGVYVFEYDLRANNAGNYSNGITQLQCMYAPEFSSHSKGMRLRID